MKCASILLFPIMLLSACSNSFWEIHNRIEVKMSPSDFLSCVKEGEKSGSIKIYAQDIGNPFGYTVVAGHGKNIEGDIHYSDGFIKFNFSSSVYQHKVKNEAKKAMNEVSNYFTECDKNIEILKNKRP